MVDYLDYDTYRDAYYSVDYDIDYGKMVLRKEFRIGRFRFLLIDAPDSYVARVFADDDRYGEHISSRFEWGQEAENAFRDHTYRIMREDLHWIGYDER